MDRFINCFIDIEYEIKISAGFLADKKVKWPFFF